MAAVTRNSAKPRTMVAGTTIKVDDGTDVVTYDLVDKESYALTPPSQERINYMNGNTPQRPLEGDLMIGSIEFEAIAGGLVEAKGLIAFATTRGADGGIKTFTTATLQIPDYDGATTGQQIVMTSPWFEGVPTYRAGKPDRIQGLRLCCKYADWAASTY